MKKAYISKIILIILVLIISYFVFFAYPIMVMPDSTEYYGYLKILYGDEELSNWNIVRGPTFPIILFIITLLFSNSAQGILIGQYIFYLITIFTGYFVLKKINYKNNVIKFICYSLYVVLIVYNPILIGYMHRVANRICDCSCIINIFNFIFKMD